MNAVTFVNTAPEVTYFDVQGGHNLSPEKINGALLAGLRQGVRHRYAICVCEIAC